METISTKKLKEMIKDKNCYVRLEAVKRIDEKK